MIQFIKKTGPWLWQMDTRFAEISFGFMILLRGVGLLLDLEAMSNPIYSGFLRVFSQQGWALTAICAGIGIIAGLFINGRWRRSPFLRFSGAVIGAVFYAMLTVLFVNSSSSILPVVTYIVPTLAFVWIALNIASKS